MNVKAAVYATLFILGIVGFILALIGLMHLIGPDTLVNLTLVVGGIVLWIGLYYSFKE